MNTRQASPSNMGWGQEDSDDGLPVPTTAFNSIPTGFPSEATRFNIINFFFSCNWRSKVPFSGLIEINDLTLTLTLKLEKWNDQ